ncbi:MAG: hypothetical protein Q7R34_02805, partial [Dehalococcoidia bacterium]|nr:hypothetical protein [Dehalococcoidia bacterium]
MIVNLESPPGALTGVTSFAPGQTIAVTGEIPSLTGLGGWAFIEVEINLYIEGILWQSLRDKTGLLGRFGVEFAMPNVVGQGTIEVQVPGIFAGDKTVLPISISTAPTQRTPDYKGSLPDVFKGALGVDLKTVAL